VKSLSDAAFFRTFDALASGGNPGLGRMNWDYAGASWVRERISVSRSAYSFAQEIFTLSSAAQPKWSLLVVKEYWRRGNDAKAARIARWTALLSGRRSDALAWFRDQARAAAV
jgi:hypothetical protein